MHLNRRDVFLFSRESPSGTLWGVAHHVTQRGNARQFILSLDGDRRVYLDLLRHYSSLYQLLLLGYCLMSNHVHLMVIPERLDSLALTLKNAHGRYATHGNVGHHSSGHVWQGRYYCCPLDEAHLWAALRYVERNPVRAGLVKDPHQHPWSSAATHCGTAPAGEWLDMELWRERWNATSWRDYLTSGGTEAEAEAIRESTHTGRPLGTPEFVESLEKTLQRRWAPQSGGRPQKPERDERQAALILECE